MIEVNASRDEKAELVQRLGTLIVRWQEATQRYDEEVGAIFQLGPAERLCLSFLTSGPQTASAIARATRLTPAAVTSLIDRLEARNFVRRQPDPHDRRKVLVEPAEATVALIRRAYEPMAIEGAATLGKRSIEELRLLSEVIEEVTEIQNRMTEQLQSGG
ncbi:MAG TPA: MarR family transcriptional regulator [Devosia sp.]|jgi:DNA-binding MarR family transcriptional regulator|uniref:MarR family winged helix-turn-helix transcriptional regulator n=1 Tax=Devosia sp. TaxID=1871048 RepID=UPI002DDCE5B6|nr:MarR family transcriptional regulator [Devosia sp.]HEV2514279.1 MarR family transcriptional regulator [Devosia sp.]